MASSVQSFRHDAGRGLQTVPGLCEGGAEEADPEPAQLRCASHRQEGHQEVDGHHCEEPSRVIWVMYSKLSVVFIQVPNKSSVAMSHCF